MDEADRMVNLGFEADLLFILDKLPAEAMAGEETTTAMEVDEEGASNMVVKKGRTRVTTLFSATMPPPVERIAKKYLRRPAVVTIGEAGRAVDTVEQRVEFVSGDEKKKQRMLEILNGNQYAPPIIVFVNQKKTADMVAKDLQRGGVRLCLRIYESLAYQFVVFSGTHRLCIRARIKSSERQRCSRCATAIPIFWLRPIWPAVVSMCRTSHSLLITRCLIQSRHTCIVLVSFPLTSMFILSAAFCVLRSRAAT
jgi:hypothetical protein